MIAIAPSLVGHCKLIKLRDHTKIALESNWNTTANYEPNDEEIINHVNSGNNYGVIPQNGAIVVDCDTADLYNLLPDEWKDSLTVITGRGHHVFLLCPNAPPKKFALNDPATNEPMGDVRGSGSAFYTVGAGSIHPDTGKPYMYLDVDAPLIEIGWEDVVTYLIDPYTKTMIKEIPKISPLSNTSSITEKLGLRIQDFAYPSNPIARANGDIQGAHPVHGSSTGMNFAINPAKNVWYCYRDACGGDPVSWIAYAMCGVSETNCNMLSKENIHCVKEWLKNHGYEKQIKAMDDEHFAEHHTQNLPIVDINGILRQPRGAPPQEQFVQPTIDPDVIARDIKAARDRNSLPPFPDLEVGSIFNDYMEFGKKVTYSLHEYHFASFMATISMALCRKVKAQVGMTTIYPNVYVMVVGHTSISGKSTACNMAWQSLQTSVEFTEPIARMNSVGSMRGTISDAALIQSLNDVYNMFWYYDDCNGFFDNIDGWNKPILGSLCTIYDGNAVERSLSRRGRRNDDDIQSRWFCPTPYMSLLFNTTNKDIENIATTDLFSSGFFPRLMWFYGQGGMPRENVDITAEDEAFIQSIAEEVKDIGEALRNLPDNSIIFGVCKMIEEWKLNATMGKLNDEDESYRVAVARGFIHAYKIAVILSMFDREFQSQVLGLDSNKYPVRVKIPDKHARLAIKIVEQYLIPRTVHVYNMCNACDVKNTQIAVLKALDHFGGSADRSAILRQTHLTRKECDIALDTLVESEEVIIHMMPPAEGGCKPKMVVVKRQ